MEEKDKQLIELELIADYLEFNEAYQKFIQMEEYNRYYEQKVDEEIEYLIH